MLVSMSSKVPYIQRAYKIIEMMGFDWSREGCPGVTILLALIMLLVKALLTTIGFH